MIRPITKRLIHAIALDMIPDAVVCCDFGINLYRPNPRYAALQWAYRHECCNDEELDKALGNGPALTEIVHRKSPLNGQSNPYACGITTIYDHFPEEEE
jgi:hypothetical protein